ncbi:hypothetical protein [Lysobacter capsici]|uniref:hypothetical protein n=1 Tax=Lysobacter capsici TaxID=435897 RepID=UPI00398CCC6B
MEIEATRAPRRAAAPIALRSPARSRAPVRQARHDHGVGPVERGQAVGEDQLQRARRDPFGFGADPHLVRRLAVGAANRGKHQAGNRQLERQDTLYSNDSDPMH